MRTLTLQREFATGVYVASPDTGKERVYMLHDIALEWAAEDLGFHELDVPAPREAAKLEIAYAK